MVAAEIGDSSSPPPPLVVSEGTNEIYCYDMYYSNYLIVYPNIPTRPKWVENTIQAAGELGGNPRDSRRTRCQFESVIFLKEPLFDDKCFVMVEYDL